MEREPLVFVGTSDLSGHFRGISNLGVSGEHGHARALAYNELTIQIVAVDW